MPSCCSVAANSKSASLDTTVLEPEPAGLEYLPESTKKACVVERPCGTANKLHKTTFFRKKIQQPRVMTIYHAMTYDVQCFF